MKPTISKKTVVQVDADVEVWWALRNLLERGVERETSKILGLEPLRKLLISEYSENEEWRFDAGARVRPPGPRFEAPENEGVEDGG